MLGYYYKSTDYGLTFSDTGLYDSISWQRKKTLSMTTDGKFAKIFIDTSIYTSRDYLSTFQKDDYTFSSQFDNIYVLNSDLTVVDGDGTWDLLVDTPCDDRKVYSLSQRKCADCNSGEIPKSKTDALLCSREAVYWQNQCNGGSILTPDGCEPCTLGYYTPGGYDTICLKCPPFRVALLSTNCNGLDTAQTNGLVPGCYCGGYIIGLSNSAYIGIIVAMMSTYLLLVVYFTREVLSLNLGISKFSLLQLVITVLLSALDTTTDLLYILVNPFGNALFLGLIIFFYLANIGPYINYLRVNKPGILTSLVTLPPFLASRSRIFIVPIYSIFMVVKSLVLFLVGYLLYTSKLMMLAPIHNKFMLWFTHSNQFQSNQLVDNENFSQSVYYELFFEAVPQIVLQVINWLYTTYMGGTIFENNLSLTISIFAGGLTFLLHVQQLIRIKLSGKKITDIKTGFENIRYADDKDVDFKRTTAIVVTYAAVDPNQTTEVDEELNNKSNLEEALGSTSQ